MTLLYTVICLTVCWSFVQASKPCLRPDGNIAILKADEICCNGQRHPKFVNGEEQECCGNTTFIPGKEYCCGGVIRLVNQNMKVDTPFCCGQELMYDQDEECCENKRIWRKTHYCNKNIGLALRKGMIACYKELYPTDYKVYDISMLTNTDCCGKDLIDKNDNTLMCENEKIITLDDQFMCSDEPYTIGKKVCCEDTGKLLPVPDYIKMHDMTPSFECVNDKVVDLYQNSVLRLANGNRVVIPKGKARCGEVYFDKTVTSNDVHCCDGILHYNPQGSNMECCGKELIDLTQKTCCNKTVYPLKMSCCGSQAYENIENRKCCAGQLIDTNFKGCCNYYNREVIANKTNPLDDKCCGRQMYNSDRKSCCGGSVVDIWNHVTEECRNNKVQPIQVTAVTSRDRVDTQELKPKPKIHEEDCLVCPSTLELSAVCTKRYEYRFHVLKMYRGSMDVVLLTPKALEGITFTLRSRQMCECIKEGKSYTMYTNRDYRRRILKQDFSLPFSSRDIIVSLRMVGLRMRPAIRCRLDPFHKEPRS